jgi:hypothetical protein
MEQTFLPNLCTNSKDDIDAAQLPHVRQVHGLWADASCHWSRRIHSRNRANSG